MSRATTQSFHLLITGVGGQGTVVASRAVASAVVSAGWRVSVGETFGASQRGGSVMSHVRAGRERGYAPLIPRGRAEVIVAFEPLEALRVLLDYGSPDTRIIMNDRPISPISCLSGQEHYPEPAQITTAITSISPHLSVIPAVTMALQLGSVKATNMIMVGALAGSGLLPIDPEAFRETIDRIFDSTLQQLNHEAFAAGLQLDIG